MSAVIAHENRNQMQMSTIKVQQRQDHLAADRHQGQQKQQQQRQRKRHPQQRVVWFQRAAAATAHHQRNIMLLALVLLLVPDFIAGLKDVSVTIPQAVKRGSNALFTCNYDMENDTLYSVKWYKGRREFYRYTPKENPAMKVFAMTSGLNVERNLSNQSHVVLQSVPLNISGKFTCEISVEAPSFQTAMVSGEMEVVELPEEHTAVTGIQPRYRIGDLVDGNCSIKYSKPAANLTWTINGIVVPPHHIKNYQIEKHENSSLESVMSAINFMVTNHHFHKGQMRLKCTASIFDIFKEEIESIIEEDRPRIMASGRSYNYGEGFDEHNESFLTYQSADSKSASAASTRASDNIFWLNWFRQTLLQRVKLPHLHESSSSSSSNDSNKDDYNRNSKFDAWQLSIFAAVIAFGLTHQIIKCQCNEKRTTNSNSSSSSSTDGCSNNSNNNNRRNTIVRTTTSSILLGQQPRLIGLTISNEMATMTTTTTTTLAVNGKCFYNCQMATLFTHPECGNGKCEKQTLDQRSCQRSRNQQNHVDTISRITINDNDAIGSGGGAGAGIGGSIEYANDLAATRRHQQQQQQQQQLSATLANTGNPPPMPAATIITTAISHYNNKANIVVGTVEKRLPPSVQDQRLLMTSTMQPKQQRQQQQQQQQPNTRNISC